MYFNSKHNQINISKILQLHDEIEILENELNIASRQLNDQTIPSISRNLRECILSLQSIYGKIGLLASCLQDISDLYEGTEAEIVRNVNDLPTDNLFTQILPSDFEDSVSEKKIFSQFDGAAYQHLPELDTQTAFFAVYLKFFPVVSASIKEIPEEWLQEKIYNWIRRKIVNQPTEPAGSLRNELLKGMKKDEPL